MRTIRKSAVLAACLSILCLAAAFGQAPIPSGPRPAWVDAPPADDEANLYFVGTGTSAAGDPREAQQFAIDDILSQIVRFLDVRITATTSAAAVGDLDDFKTAISRQVTETAGARLTGFRVTGRWSAAAAGGLAVHVLVAYEKAALLAEKMRLDEIFQSSVNAVRIPEAEGEALAAAGAHYEAARKFIEAAVAAAESTLEDSQVALNRTLARAMETLARINLLKLNDNLTFTAGEVPAEAFSLRVAAGAGPGAPGVPRADVRVTFYESKGGTDRSVKTVVLQSDGDGLLAFKHPAPTFAGKGQVEMLLDLSAWLDKLKPAERKAGEKVAALRRLALSKRQEFAFTAAARARDRLLAVFVVDTDENGRPLIRHQATAGGLGEALTRQGFTLKAAAIDPGRATAEDAELTALILAKVPGAGRAIVGTAAVESASNDAGRFVVRVTANIRIIDLAGRKVLFQQNLMKSSTGSSLDSARTAAFRQVGRELGARIAADLN